MKNTPMKPLTDEQDKKHMKDVAYYICYGPFNAAIACTISSKKRNQQGKAWL